MNFVSWYPVGRNRPVDFVVGPALVLGARQLVPHGQFLPSLHIFTFPISSNGFKPVSLDTDQSKFHSILAKRCKFRLSELIKVSLATRLLRVSLDSAGSTEPVAGPLEFGAVQKVQKRRRDASPSLVEARTGRGRRADAAPLKHSRPRLVIQLWFCLIAIPI